MHRHAPEGTQGISVVVTSGDIGRKCLLFYWILCPVWKRYQCTCFTLYQREKQNPQVKILNSKWELLQYLKVGFIIKYVAALEEELSCAALTLLVDSSIRGSISTFTYRTLSCACFISDTILVLSSWYNHEVVVIIPIVGIRKHIEVKILNQGHSASKL